eukprot:3063139-Pleurochrysis_carterae.AAC.1
MDAAKAEQHGDVLGLGVYCHGLFFSLPLAARTRSANSIATFKLMALVAAIAIFHAFFRHFPRVVLELESLSATFHLVDDSQSNGQSGTACA